MADISCSNDGMVWSYSGGLWACGVDMVLDSADVVGFVEAESDLILGSGTTINGEPFKQEKTKTRWQELLVQAVRFWCTMSCRRIGFVEVIKIQH